MKYHDFACFFKHVVIASVLAFSSITAWAGGVKHVGGSVNVGVDFPLDQSYHNGDNKMSVMASLDVRVYLKSLPIDVGGYLSFWAVGRRFPEPGYNPDDPGNLPSVVNFNQSNNSFTIGALSHWYFRPDRKVNPFAGLGVGVSVYNTPHDFYPSEGCTVSFSPRVGVELWKHLRIGIQTQLMRRGYNSMALTIGASF